MCARYERPKHKRWCRKWMAQACYMYELFESAIGDPLFNPILPTFLILQLDLLRSQKLDKPFVAMTHLDVEPFDFWDFCENFTGEPLGDKNFYDAPHIDIGRRVGSYEGGFAVGHRSVDLYEMSVTIDGSIGCVLFPVVSTLLHNTHLCSLQQLPEQLHSSRQEQRDVAVRYDHPRCRGGFRWFSNYCIEGQDETGGDIPATAELVDRKLLGTCRVECAGATRPFFILGMDHPAYLGCHHYIVLLEYCSRASFVAIPTIRWVLNLPIRSNWKAGEGVLAFTSFDFNRRLGAQI
jgi:hypothetical protein